MYAVVIGKGEMRRGIGRVEREEVLGKDGGSQAGSCSINGKKKTRRLLHLPLHIVRPVYAFPFLVPPHGES